MGVPSYMVWRWAGYHFRIVAKSGQWTTIWSVCLHNFHAGGLREVPVGVTMGSLLGLFSANKNMIEPLISSDWVMELPMDSASISSSWERRTMAERRLARASWKRGM